MDGITLSPAQQRVVTLAFVEHKADIGLGDKPDEAVAEVSGYLFATYAELLRRYGLMATLATPEGEEAREAIARLHWLVMIMRGIANGTLAPAEGAKLN